MKKNSWLGYLTGIVCGLIFSIPSLLVYALFGKFLGYLSILTVFGIIVGYKLINKEMYNTKSTRLYLILSSLIINAANLIIFYPVIMFAGYKGINILSDILSSSREINISEVVNLFKGETYLKALIINLIITSVLVIIPSIFLPMDYKKNEDELSECQDFKEKVHKLFVDNNALTKKTAIDKKIIKEGIKNIPISDFKKYWYLDFLKNFKIKSKKGKWYYKEGKKNKFRFGIFASILFIIIFAGISNVLVTVYNLNNKVDDSNFYIEKKQEEEKAKLINYDISDTISMLLPDCFIKFQEKEDNSGNTNSLYYSYITANGKKTNLSAVEIFYTPEYNVSNYDDFKSYLEENLSKYNILEEEDKIINNNKTLYFKADNINDKSITKVYFILYDGQLFEVYIHVNKENYTKEDDIIVDQIMESINSKKNH